MQRGIPVSRIDTDMAAIRVYLAEQDPPSSDDIQIARKYRAAWKKRGYTETEAATAVRWFRAIVPTSRDYRPATVDSALGEAVRATAAGTYKFDKVSASPCSQCRYLDLNPRPNCDRLLIWVAHPDRSTCSEFKEGSR